MTPIFACLMLAAALGAAPSPAAGEEKMERREKSVIDASFELVPPAGWAIERRAGVVLLTGPAAQDVPALISVRFVRPDHALYGTPEEYMNRLTKPSSIPIKGWKNGEVEKVETAGRKALRLERDTTQFTAPHTISTKEVAMREEHLAVSAAKGFYVLIYTAPRSIDEAQRPEFRRLVENGFKPKL